MKKIMLVTFITLATLGISAQTTNSGFSFNTGNDSVFTIQDGEFTVNGKVVKEGFSINQSDSDFLFFYVPEQGLFTVSKNEFDGADQSGTIYGKNLNFQVENTTVMLKSSSSILNKEDVVPIWVKFDSKFRLKNDSVIIGYGSKENLPYDWKNQVKTNRK